MPALGWDGLNPEMDDRQLLMLENQSRRRLLTRMDNNRSPFPPGFMVGGSSRDHFGGEYDAWLCLATSLILVS